MKTKLIEASKALSMAATALWGISALAGGMESGGGGAFVWRQGNAVTKASLVDLWEAENIPFAWPQGAGTITVKSGSGSPEEQIGRALGKLAAIDSGFAAQVRRDYEYLLAHTNDLPKSVSIQLPDDLRLTYYPEGSLPEGMMRFNGLTGKLDRNTEIFGKLEDSTNVAAAWTHEAVYKTLRESSFAHRDSIQARHLNACLYSESATCLEKQAVPALVPVSRPELFRDLKCAGPAGEFVVHEEGKGIRVYYQRLGDVKFGSATYQEAAYSCRQPIPDYEYYCDLKTAGPLQNSLNHYGYSSGEVSLGLKLSFHSEGTFREVGSPLLAFKTLVREGGNVPVDGRGITCTPIERGARR